MVAFLLHPSLLNPRGVQGIEKLDLEKLRRSYFMVHWDGHPQAWKIGVGSPD